MLKQIIQANETLAPNVREMAVLKEHFPGCFRADGSFDIERFRQTVSASVDISQEGYELRFLGKNYARLLESLETETVIRPDAEHNAKPENAKSENLYITGDNLDALKHLCRSYIGKVKCIYIDPPYNTGSDDFVYCDTFGFSAAELQAKLGIDETQATRLLEFTRKGSSSHSAWLLFMFPRLQLARELLSDDGVIFISIDDNEQANLKLLCDDVFGEESFISTVVWKKKTGAGVKIKCVFDEHEYLLIYTKEVNIAESWRILNESDGSFKNPDNDERGEWESCAFTAPSKNQNPNQLFMIEIHYGITDKASIIDGDMVHKEFDSFAYQGNFVVLRYVPKAEELDYSYYNEESRVARFVKRWAYASQNIKAVFRESRVYFKEGNVPRYKKFKSEYDGKALRSIYFEEFSTQQGTDVLRAIFSGRNFFEYPKPVNLIKHFIGAVCKNEDIALDFFSGSGTTAQAVMELNADDKGNRKFILVQLPEVCKEDSEAKKAGFRTIDEIGRKRIELAAAKIREANPMFAGNLGFRHFRLETPPQNTLDKMVEFDPKAAADVFAGPELLDGLGRDTVLRTWLVRDGYGFTAEATPVKLAEYTAQWCGKHLYLIEPGFDTEALTELFRRYERDGDFSPTTVVVFGYSFTDWTFSEMLQTNLRLLAEGVKQLQVAIDTRY